MQPKQPPLALFSETASGSTGPAGQTEPQFYLEVEGRLPSWNDILGMEQWARYKFKKQLASVFMSALLASDGTCSTKTICAKNTTLIYADTLARSLLMLQAKRALRSAKKKLAAKNENSLGLKSSDLPPPAPKPYVPF